MFEWFSKFIFRNWIDILPRETEIDLVLNTVPVATVTRRLRAVWTPELVQEIYAYQSNDQVWTTEYKERRIAAAIKRSRYKDRKIYIKEIEEWTGIKISVAEKHHGSN